MNDFKKMKKLLDRPLPPCIKPKVMKAIAEINKKANKNTQIPNK